MASKAGRKTVNILIWGLLALLIVGLAGFGTVNFGGTSTAVATVDGREISGTDYFRALNGRISAAEQQLQRQITVPEAEQMGLTVAVQGELMGQAALNNEADRLGLSAGDERVAARIVADPNFQGISGNFDRESYEFVLDRNGIKASDYEDDVRLDAARALVQDAVAAGTPAPAFQTAALIDYFGQRRDVRWLALGPNDLSEPLPQPTEAMLQAHYDANPEAYTQPETREITYAVITPDMILDQIELDETAVQALYDERISQFQQPERRLVERLVFSSTDAAEAALARIEAGEITFPELVAERGLTLEDVDLGERSEDSLGAAGADVFALEEPGIVGPVESDLGPVLYRMNGILSAQEVSFDEARGDLEEELRLAAARREIDQIRDDLDDRLAAGATIEDLANETDMEIGDIDWYPGVERGIASYTAFTETAAALEEGDFPELVQLADGGLFAARLDDVVPPTLRPLDEIREEVIAGWRNAEIRDRLMEQARTVQAQMGVGSALEDQGYAVETAKDVTRTGYLDGTPAEMLTTIFDLGAPGDTALLDEGNEVFLVTLDAINPPAEEDEQIALFRDAISEEINRSLANDVLTLYARELTDRSERSLNSAGIASVHSQIR
tara:strand:- start:25 stop:1878 length:1854 start_codon:yes stop_codon:yes gene_type:complete